MPMFWSVDFVSTSATKGITVTDAAAAATAAAAASSLSSVGQDGGEDYGYVMTGMRCAVSGKVVRGMEAMDATTLSSLVGRALPALVPLPYARAEARAQIDAERERMTKQMEERQRVFEEERVKMEAEKQTLLSSSYIAL